MKHLVLFIIAAFALTLLIWAMLHWPKNNRSNLYASRQQLIEALQQDTSEPHVQDKTALDERLSKVFDKRLQQYKSNLDSQNANLWYQVLFVAIALIIVLKGSGDFTIPKTDIKVPVRWAYWAVPVCLAYLWMSFGFRLHELVDSRIALYKIAEARLPQPEQDKPEDLSVGRTFGDYSAVNDGSILDGWFISFRYNYALEPTAPNYKRPFQMVSGFSMILLGGFLGISNGTMLGLILHGSKRFGKRKAIWRNPGYVAAFGAAAVLLVLTHFTFWYGGRHPNWLQPIVIFVACATVYAFVAAPIAKKLQGEGKQ